MEPTAPSMLRATALAGGLTGALAGLPYLDVANGCTCMSLVWACGLVAAFLYSREAAAAGVAFRAGNGATVGLVAGAFHALAQSMVSAASFAIVGPVGLRWFLETLKALPDLPADTADAVDAALAQVNAAGPADALGGFFLTLLIAAVCSTVGGLAGGALFRREPPRRTAFPEAEDRNDAGA